MEWVSRSAWRHMDTPFSCLEDCHVEDRLDLCPLWPDNSVIRK